MNENTFDEPRVTVLGLGAMGTALARTWLAAGHPVTVWNRTAARAEALAGEGADVAATAADAVAAGGVVVTCLWDDESVGTSLADADLRGRDLVDLTTGTPAQARGRAAWAEERGARFVSGGIMAVPPMVGVPEAGGYVFYSGSKAAFAAAESVLSVPLGTRYVGEDAGFAALYDVALLSGMIGMFGGVAHAFALVRGEDVPLKEFGTMLVEWLRAMAALGESTAERLESGDYTSDVVSNLAMMVNGNAVMRRTAEEQGIGSALLDPYMELMERRLAQGHGEEDGPTGVIDLLAAR
ncbi:3-hydroxyisobutyrate dehydrogenase-like beta-hydroxyacid dehydrogenase [Nocardiopsis sp. Huas11]|uniref:NAD(P)-dependent oxidoreductase n=1 Tax=Nocardiopsis sp. Huas11 TaxID=2183912 RepID=UPI000EAE9F6F|nr:NAD(P)-binding domain-containing protein [Nocardiopsis sp. Huas11]RKS05404.1 3-hydroxyisobutyrate dehydrogenase-like beta-hydroxyacid dehydrogenase [Nocardiopsis sp. Huas11]